MSERCPVCAAALPALKTCANEACRREFYRSEGGRLGALYCKRACAQAQYQRNRRRRVRDAEAATSSAARGTAEVREAGMAPRRTGPDVGQ